MQLLSNDQLFVLELLAAELENRPPHGVLTNREIEALRIALPRWIKMERTVTEAHTDAANDYPGVEIYLWPNTAKVRAPWWRRLWRWYCRRAEHLGEVCDE